MSMADKGVCLSCVSCFSVKTLEKESCCLETVNPLISVGHCHVGCGRMGARLGQSYWDVWKCFGYEVKATCLVYRLRPKREKPHISKLLRAICNSNWQRLIVCERREQEREGKSMKASNPLILLEMWDYTGNLGLCMRALSEREEQEGLMFLC